RWGWPRRRGCQPAVRRPAAARGRHRPGPTPDRPERPGPRPARSGALRLALGDEDGAFGSEDRVAGDDAFGQPGDRREVVHHVEHDVLEDGPEPAGAGP